jgi:hypothetical protein
MAGLKYWDLLDDGDDDEFFFYCVLIPRQSFTVTALTEYSVDYNVHVQ